MQQLTFTGVGQLTWQEVPEPSLDAPTSVLVRPIAAARCDLDSVWMTSPMGRTLRLGLAAHLIDKEGAEGILGAPPFAPPFAVGHECVAEILSVGDDVQGFQVGQRVVVPFQIACGHCNPCGRGVTSRCSTGPLAVTTYGFGPGARLHGGVLCDVLLVPFADAMLVEVPEGVESATVASASDNLPDAYRTVASPLRDNPGANVLVVGGVAASIGLYAAGMAHALGAGEVHYVDTDPDRLKIAEKMGAKAIPAEKNWKGIYRGLTDSYAITVDACSDSAGRGLELALRSLQPGGVCTSAGIYPRKRTKVPLMDMYYNGSTLHTGITNARALIPDVLALIASGRFDPTPVATLVAPWAQADRAFLEKTTKVIVSRT